jgi:hypothetical protein
MRGSWHCEVGRELTATLESKGVKLMAIQITTLPKGLVGMIQGLANPGLRGCDRGVGQKVGTLIHPTLSRV